MEILTCLKHITVEPITFLYIFSWSLMSPTENLFFYQRSCSERYNDEDICNNLHNSSYAVQEIQVQSDLAQLQFEASLSGRILPILFSLLYGVLTDKYGSKLTMFIPLLGAILEATLYITMVLNPTWPIKLYLLAKALLGISGGMATYCMAMFSYITSVTSEKNRTGRIGIAEGAATIGFAFGYLTSGVLLEATSFIFVFFLTIGCNTVAVLYLILCINSRITYNGIISSDNVRSIETHQATNELTSSNGNETNDSKICCKIEEKRNNSSVYCFQFVKEMFRKRPRNGRIHLMVLLVSLSFMILGDTPFYVLMFLFTKKQPLSWSQSLYGIYKGVTHIGQAIGELFLLPLMKKMKVKDTYLMFAAILSKIALGIILAWAKTTWLIFAGGMVAFFAGNMVTCCRSLVSFLLNKNEVGKVYAVMGSIQGISEMAGYIIFPKIYSMSLIELWAGFSFLLSSLIYIPPFLLAAWLHFDMKKRGILKKDCTAPDKNIETCEE